VSDKKVFKPLGYRALKYIAHKGDVMLALKAISERVQNNLKEAMAPACVEYLVL
jgi:hypothetical protein